MRRFRQFALFIRTNFWIIPLALLLCWLLVRYLDPAPPRHLVMTTGSETGGYHQFGLSLQRELKAQGLDLELRTSRGSLDNLDRLTDGSGDVQLGLIQSGTEKLLPADQRQQLLGLAALYHEPLWLFQRKESDIQNLSDLSDKRVSVGSEGSGTWAVVHGLFEQQQDVARLDSLNGGLWVQQGASASAAALLAGELDAAFFVLPVNNRVIISLLADPGVELVSAQQAHAFAARLRYVDELQVSQGLLSIPLNLPPRDLTLLAPVATLVANESFHPALAAQVLEATRKVLRDGNLLDPPGTFPAATPMALELSPEAEYYHRQGMPVLQRYLPFQLASMIDRYVVLVIPFLAIMFPLLRSMGPLYRWRVRARVYRWYEHLRRVDRLIYSGRIKGHHDEEIAKLRQLESELNHVDVPLSYAHELYSLHLHVRFMIYRLGLLQEEERAESVTD